MPPSNKPLTTSPYGVTRPQNNIVLCHAHNFYPVWTWWYAFTCCLFNLLPENVLRCAYPKMWLIVSYNSIFHLLVNPTENHTCWLLILGKWLIFYFENVFNCFIWTIPVFKYMFTTCHVPTLSHSSESQYHIIISLSSLCRHIWRRHSTYEMLIMNILSNFYPRLSPFS